MESPRHRGGYSEVAGNLGHKPVPMASIRLANAAKFYQALPHQLAAWNWLNEKLSDDLLTEFEVMYRADPDLKLTNIDPSMAWRLPCLSIIKDFEGCRLAAYPDPGTGSEPWTIGWGATFYEDGAPVKQGDAITNLQADALLVAQVTKVRNDVLRLLPLAANWSGERQAALISFTYNIGTSALEGSTLRKRLLAGEDPAKVVAEELPRWNKPVAVSEGLNRRRAAEIALFLGTKPATPQPTPSTPAKSAGVLLKVPYEFQLDNASGSGYRECFSSSCAMVARFYGQVSGDDEYNRLRQRFGDSTDANAQIKALQHLGLKASFHQNGSIKTLESLLDAGQPVPVGWLHKGPVEHPSGGGHWTVAIGYDKQSIIHNDPNGEARMVEGGYVRNTAASGQGIRYSRTNWLRRWLVEGKRSGWYLNVSKA